MQSLGGVADEVLLRDLHGLVGSHRRVTAELIVYLGEVDARRLHVGKGFSSLFVYCVQQLRFSEDEACRRIEAARMVRKYPVIFPLLEAGKVSLSVLGLLKSHLNAENHVELLAGVSGKSVRKAEEWLAARFPRPDVAPSIRKLPERVGAGVSVASLILESPATSRVQIQTLGAAPDQSHPLPSVTLRAPTQSAGSHQSGAPNEAPRGLSATETLSVLLAEAEPARSSTSSANANPALSSKPRGNVEPFSSERFVVKFTVTREEKELLELARDLLSHANPSGDIGAVVVRGIQELVAKLQSRKLGQTKRPREAKRPRANGSSSVTQSVRREVVDRDGFECSFVSEDGHRCGARAFLEFEHRQPRGKGGDSGAQNLRLFCRAHNRLVAEQAYGKDRIAQAIEARDNRSPHIVREQQRSHLYLHLHASAPRVGTAAACTLRSRTCSVSGGGAGS